MNERSRIDSILGEWLEKRDQDGTLDPDEVIRAHPDLAEELRRRFRALSLLQEAHEEARDLRPLPEGRYGDFKVTGEGGMGIVYWALDTDLNRQVAFKIVRPDVGGGKKQAPSLPIGLVPPTADTPASKAFETLKARFLQEAWVTAGLEHPGIVPVYELGQTPEGVPYYTMRFVRGSQTLATLIEEAKEKPIEDRLALLEPFLRVCDTIRYAHAHDVIHRDLKPENVAIGEFGEVVVLDWGLAKLKGEEDTAAETWQERLKEYREASDLRTMASAMGTPGYMAPEASLGKIDELDERCDVYGLGAILFEILTGRLPFEFETYIDLVMKLKTEDPPKATEIDAAVPVELSSICARAIARQKEDRYAGAGELAEAIRTWQRESAAEREIRELLAKAEAACEGTEGLEGEALLKQLDRLATACARITDKVPDHPRAAELVGECEGLRERAIGERERTTRRRVLARGGAAVLAAAVIAAILVVGAIEGKRREAEEARSSAETARGREAMARERAEEAAVLADRERARSNRLLSLAEAERGAGRLAEGHPLGLLDLVRATRTVEDQEGPRRSRAREWALWSPLVCNRLRHIVGFDGEWAPTGLRAIGFSPDGKYLATASVYGVQLWNSETGLPFGPPLRHSVQFTPNSPVSFQGVRSAVFLPDGSRLAIATADGTVRLWEPGIDKPPGDPMLHESPPWDLAVSPSGELLATAHGDGTVMVWSVETGKPYGRAEDHEGGARAVDFSPDGRLLATASRDGTLRLWDLGTMEPVGSTLELGSRMYDVCFSPTGEYVAGAGRGARIWHVESGKQVGVDLDQVSVNQLNLMAFHPAGKLFAARCGDKTARIWDLEKERPHGPALLHREWVGQVAFSPDGHTLGTLDGERGRLWSVETGAPVGPALHHSSVMDTLVFHPRGRLLATGSRDRTVRIWDLSAHADSELVLDHGRDNYAVAWSPDSARLATVSSRERTARLWDATTGEPIGDPIEHDEPLNSVAISPDGRLLATGGGAMSVNMGVARVFDLETAEILAGPFRHPEFSRERTHINLLAFHPDGGLLATGARADYTYAVRLWDLERKTLAGPPLRHDKPVRALAFAPDGGRLVTGTEEAMYVWDLRSLPYRSRKIPHETGVKALAFARVGGQLAVASGDRTVRLLAPDTLAPTGPPTRLSASSRLLDVSPDGTLVATRGRNAQEVRLWDVASNRAVGRPLLHPGSIYQVSFSPEGRSIATACVDGKARIWRLAAPPAGIEEMVLQTQVALGVRFDAEGLVQSIPWRDWRRLRAELRGALPAEAEPPAWKDPQQPWQELDESSDSTLLTGRVVTPEGEAVPDATVRIWGSGPLVRGPVPHGLVISRHPGPQVTRTGADGRFRFPRATAKRIEIGLRSTCMVMAEEGERASPLIRHRLGEPDAATVELVLRPAVRFFVRVLRQDGEPLRGAFVSVTKSWSAEEGGRSGRRSVKVADVSGPDGRVTLVPVHHEDSASYRLTVLHREAPQHDQELDVPSCGSVSFEPRLDQGMTVWGRVLGADGRPLLPQPVRVCVRRDSGLQRESWSRAKTDEDGWFEVRGVPTKGAVLEITTRGHIESVECPEGAPGGIIDLGTIAVKTSRQKAVRLSQTKVGVIRGRVRLDGEPLAGARVTAMLGGSRVLRWTQTADSDGRFVTDPLPAGEYTLEARHPEERIQATVSGLRPGTKDIVIDLTLGGTILLTFHARGAECEPLLVDGLTVRVLGDRFSVGQGSSRPCGRIRIHLPAAMKRRSVKVEIVAEGYRKVTLEEVTIAPERETALAIEMIKD